MTTHNGPGLRTLILFKGYPLRCLWCSTPESQKSEPEIAVFPDKCILCNQCISSCPREAIMIKKETINIKRSLCNACGKCAQECYTGAIEVLGQPMGIDDLLEEVKKDSVIYRQSHGGVTISGGEPLLYPAFNGRLLKALKDEAISVGVDTCGYVPWINIEHLLPYIDFFSLGYQTYGPGKTQGIDRCLQRANP